MRFDEQGHIVWTPKALFQMAVADPLRLVNGYLMAGTPWAFADYGLYRDFLDALAERTGVHPRDFFLRGSCQVGFSIAPKEKVWTVMGERSDLDLVIVDAAYFHRIDEEIWRWEERNPAHSLQDRAVEDFAKRRQDRQFNCCRDTALPSVVCVHHQDRMKQVADLSLCGIRRKLSAFIYPDWHSARRRYEYDLRMLRRGVEEQRLTPPGEQPFPRESRQPQPPAPTAPTTGPKQDNH